MDIRSEIIRTFAVQKSPLDYSPIAWYRGDDAPSLLRVINNGTTLTPTTTGNINGSSDYRDSLEELSTGYNKTTAFDSNDLEMHRCDQAEWDANQCANNAATLQQRVGIQFSGVNIPRNSTISSATLEIQGGTPSGTAGSMTTRIRGIYQAANNPHINPFFRLDQNVLRDRLNNTALITSAFVDATSNNFPPGNAIPFNVTTIVQEMVNNPNWDPTAGSKQRAHGICFSKTVGQWVKASRKSEHQTNNNLLLFYNNRSA